MAHGLDTSREPRPGFSVIVIIEWGGYSITDKWEVSTDGGDAWSAAGTDDRYTRSIDDDEECTLLLRLTATNDFDEKLSRTWEISVGTGCGRAAMPRR
ncbi:MAG: hypothetical protein OXJ54_00080 [Gemmatimonadetes bacterium]|nr:hypothetical protein [Candidatus Palauibacter rhopaloidicola]MDE0259625.1 hypothetical protein [Gammaproteobacteria bacterium]